MSHPRPLLSVQGAAFGFGTTRILQDINLEICGGQALGILGPNGAGKTTLMRGLLGLLKPMAGSVRRHTKAIAYVPQQDRLGDEWPLSTYELVCMGSANSRFGARWHTSSVRAAAEVKLDLVGLLDKRSEPFSSLSGGQRQRALIARALMREPELLLLDEPTSGVDRPNQIEIMGILGDLASGGDDAPSVLLVAHQLDLVAGWAKEILWVEDGGVERRAVGEADSIEKLAGLFGCTNHG
ncbi:MAG: zinc/manganese transport system ATP-binding protein [Bacteroidia bacterium]|jgi:zinc/manganese transport system ATP-binding protein